MTSASIRGLWHYPVKSMRGEEANEVELGPGGVLGDRAYGFLDVETGRLVSAKRPKRFGALLNCRARFVAAPSADAPAPPVEVTFPDDTVVCGDGTDSAELTRRVTELLGREVRLISSAPDGLTFESEPANEGDPAGQFPVAMAAPGTLLDLAALHILAANTLRRLTAEYPSSDWDPRRLRPNMLIDAGDTPADEDEWIGCDLHLGDDTVIHVVGPTPRCVMTTLAQAGLPRDPGVLKTIAGIGLKQIEPLGQFACAGSYAEVVTPGVVRRGDQVRIERVQPREGVLAATIDTIAAAFAAGP
jgi:hypothetical protein